MMTLLKRDCNNKIAFDDYEGKMDIWYAFFCLSLELLMVNCNQNFYIKMA
jgi:hypothetical protein